MRLICLTLVFVIGCAASREKTTSFEGKVTTKGFTLPSSTKLLFNPTDGGKKSAECVMDASGNFKIKNMVIGKYIVTFRSPNPEDVSFYKKIPVKFHDQGVAVEVTESTNFLDVKFN